MKEETNGIRNDLVRLYSLQNSMEENKIGSTYKNLGDQVYDIIKNKIICHEIKPGERIIDKHLADEMGVSRSLVRQAFNILEKEELITLVPRSGFYVRKISQKDVEEIYDIRKILEEYITELAVPVIPDNDIAEVDKIFEEARKDLEKDRVEKFIKADASLHELLINNCENERLKKIATSYNSHFVFYRLIDLSRVERAKEAYFEHREIFEAVKERDVERAVKLMGKHVENAKNIILKNFDKYTFG